MKFGMSSWRSWLFSLKARLKGGVSMEGAPEVLQRRLVTERPHVLPIIQGWRNFRFARFFVFYVEIGGRSNSHVHLCGGRINSTPNTMKDRHSVEERGFEVSVASTSGIFVPAFSLPLQLVASSTPKMSFLFDVWLVIFVLRDCCWTAKSVFLVTLELEKVR